MSAANSKLTAPLQTLLALLFAGLLSIPFLDQNKFYFAWFAFIPLLFAIENASLKRTYFLGLLAGFLLFLLGTYWVYDYIVLAKDLTSLHAIFLAVAGWIYSAQVIAIGLLLYKYLSLSTRISDFVIFPLVIVFTFSVFPMLFAIRLGESQINFYYALQATEIFGVYGLDMLIALSNIVLYRLLYTFFCSEKQTRGFSKIALLMAVACIGLWFIYGVYSYSHWNNKMHDWETIKIGIVQPNELPAARNTQAYASYSLAFPPEMEMTKRLSKAGAELVIWPEAQSKNYLNNSKVQAAYSKTIEEIQSSLLFQDTKQVSQSGLNQDYNMAVMLNEQGEEQDTYTKIKRIPIGEYIPFIRNNESLQSLSNNIFGQSAKTLEQGESFKVFAQAKVNIIPLICYETTFPNFVARAVNASTNIVNNAKPKMLVGLSNDGWFNSFNQSKQHILASSIRAVENRLPLVHAVNNGPSIVVLPNGKRIFSSNFQQAGGYLINVPYAEETKMSFFSKYPNWFLYFMNLILLLIFIHALRHRL